MRILVVPWTELKTREKLDEASREIREAIDNLKEEVERLSSRVKEKLKGTGEEMRESAHELTRELKGLTEKIKELLPGKRKRT